MDNKVLIKLVVDSHEGTEHTMNVLCHKISVHLGRQEPFHLLIDTTPLVHIEFKALYKQVLLFLRANRERIAKYVVASSIIVSRDVIAMLLRAVFKVYTPASPLKIVSTEADGLAFLGF